MIYRVVRYDRTSEHMKGSLIVPLGVLTKVKKADGFQANDDGLGEYELAESQIRRVAEILGFRPEPDRFYYYVEPYEPPDDCGFQEPPGDAAPPRQPAASPPSPERATSTWNSGLGTRADARVLPP